MRVDNQHIIRKQTIEIIFDRQDNSAGLQNQVKDVFYDQLLPRMEVIFDKFCDKNQFISIDKLEIDCGHLEVGNWEQEFTSLAIEKLKLELNQVIKKVFDIHQFEEISATETFFFFLENGFMPWNNRIDSISELEQFLIVDEKLVLKLKALILQNEKVADRLAYQFSDEFHAKIISAFFRNSDNGSLSAIFEKTGELQNGMFGQFSNERHLVDATILKVFASEKSKNRELQFFTLLGTKIENNTEIKEIIKELQLNSEKQSQASEDQVNTDEYDQQNTGKIETESSKHGTEISGSDKTIYIRNAGLVLLHPFLPALFQQLNLTNDKAWMNENSQQKAVLILEFLTTGKGKMEEFDLMLNKILCGINLDEIVATELEIGIKIQIECEDLLKEVIQHWNVLKNTGIDGFREAFVQRNGKLSKVNDGWLLQVEQKTIDILLNHLPWGIGIIKLPWMNEMLYVEWT